MKMKNNAWQEVNINIVKHYVEAFDLNYWKTEAKITNAFRESQSSEDIRERIHLLNAFYHTRVPIDSMGIVFQKIGNIDSMIKEGDENAVIAISQECEGRCYFSFSTKYCCFSNPDAYPIYDSLSIKTLQWFNDKKHFYSDSKIDFDILKKKRDYKLYREIVKRFKDDNNLSLSYKDLDKFLWLVGKNM